MIRCFWLVFLLTVAGGQALAQAGQVPARGIEQRVEHWRDLLREGHQAAVIDSCQRLLSRWPDAAPTRLRATVLTLQANALRQSRRPEEALSLHRSACSMRQQIFGKKHPEVASSLQNIGNCLLDLGQPQEALQALRQAASIKEHYFKSDPSRLLNTYTSLGQCLTDLGEYAQAEYYLSSAMAIEARLTGTQSPQMALCLLSLADLYTASQAFDSSLAVLRRVQHFPLDTLGRDHETYILILNNLGNACAASGRSAEAQAWLHRAISRCDERPGQTQPLRGRCLLNLGNAQFDMGDFAAAEATFRSARAHFRAAPADEAACLNALALTLRYRDRSEDAVDTLLSAYNLCLQAGSNNVRRRDMAGICMNLGSAYLDRSAYSEAQFYFQKALNLYLRLPRSAADRAACHDKLGLSRFRQGDMAAAYREWSQAQVLASAGSPSLRFSIWLHQGDALARQARWATAADAYRSAAAAIGIGDLVQVPVFPYETMQLQVAQARMALLRSRESGRRSHWEAALTQARMCIEMLSMVQTQLQAEQSALEMQSTFDTPYDVAVEAALALGRTELAWQFSEGLKSSMLERMSYGVVEWSHMGLPDTWAEAEHRRRLRLAHFLRLRSTVDGPQWAFVDDSIRRLSEGGQQFRQMLVQQYPSQFQLLFAPPPPAVADVRRQLRSDQSFLCYHWGQERAWAFVLRKDTLLAFHLALTDSTRSSAERFFRHCAANPYGVADDQRQRTFRQMCTDGLALYHALGAPVEAALTASVLVVPDGLLCVLPFEALLVEADMGAPHRFHRHRFWAAQHHFGYVHSVAAWLQVKSARTRPASHGLLAVAPSFEENPHGLRPLRHNAAEADSVHVLRGGEVWKGEAATRTRFEAEAGRYGVLLLSTHGVMDHREPLSSFVGFYAAPGGPDSAEASLLRVADVYGLRLSADLVVLSACQTASGQLYRGTGMMSMARAFQYAGARALVASLWNVDDRNTPALMRSFFSFLGKNMDKPAALTLSKRVYLGRFQGLDAHPYYWAGLIGMGDDASLGTSSSSGWWGWGGGSLLLLLAGAAAAWWRYRK